MMVAIYHQEFQKLEGIPNEAKNLFLSGTA